MDRDGLMDYLLASRYVNLDVTLKTGPFNELYERIKRTYAYEEIDFPDIVLVFSKNRISEVIKAGRRSYVVYDLYHELCLTMITNILFSDIDPGDLREAPASSPSGEKLSLLYAYRHIADRLHIEGHKVLSYQFAMRYDTQKREYGNDLDSTPLEEIIAIQRVFLLCHEMAHYLFSVDDKMLENYVYECVKSTLREGDQKGTDIFHLEEIACDNFASRLAYLVLCDPAYGRIHRQRVAKFIAVSMLAQRALSSLDDFVDLLIRNDKPGFSDSRTSERATARSVLNRFEITSDLWSYGRDPDPDYDFKEELGRELGALTERFEAIIEGPFWRVIFPELERMSRYYRNQDLQLAARKGIPDFREWSKDIDNYIDCLTGFRVFGIEG